MGRNIIPRQKGTNPCDGRKNHRKKDAEKSELNAKSKSPTARGLKRRGGPAPRLLSGARAELIITNRKTPEFGKKKT